MSTDNDTTLLKKCSKCKQKFPATSEYFNRMKSSKDGLQAYCKSCCRAYESTRDAKEGHERFVAKKALLNSGYKECSVCHEVKPLSEYYKQRNISSGVHAACKLCYSVKMGWEPNPRKQFPKAPEGYKYCRKCDQLKTELYT